METITTTDTSGANLKVVIAIDTTTIAILATAIFLALLVALFIYKKI